jgi:hypothetical protein
MATVLALTDCRLRVRLSAARQDGQWRWIGAFRSMTC